jgi:uncharacterized cupredoxin-like copper-binding protein
MPRIRTMVMAMTLTTGLLLVGCSSDKKTDSSSSGGVTVTTAAASGTKVAVTVSDTKGLDAPMTMTATPTTVPAGDVTFSVKNTGTIDHEMLVVKTDTPFDQIPITDAGDPPAPVTTGADKVSEDGKVGETGDPNVKPGETRTFTVKGMTAGKYVLLCNIAKHYGLQMRMAFTVS